jgi:hypothetical protein
MDATQVARLNELSQQYHGSRAIPQTAAFLTESEKKEVKYLLELRKKHAGQAFDEKIVGCNHACYLYKDRGKQEALDIMYRHRCDPDVFYDERCKADLMNYHAEMLKHRATQKQAKARQNLANLEKKIANDRQKLINTGNTNGAARLAKLLQRLANTEKKPENTTNQLANKTAGISLGGGKTRRHRTRKSRSRRSRK